MAYVQYGRREMEEEEEDQNAVQSAINKAMKAWLKENPEDEDTARSPRAHVKRSLGPVPRGHTLPQTFFLANDGSMKCTLCSTSGFWEKDDLREHINTHHTGGYQFYCKLCTKRFRFKTTFLQHMQVDHKGVTEDVTYDGRSENVLRMQEDVIEAAETAQRVAPTTAPAPNIEVVVEEVVVTQPGLEVVTSSEVNSSAPAPPPVAQSAAVVTTTNAAGAVPTVNGDAGPDEAAAPLRLGPAESVEQSVLIAPPLEAPKRRINYTILRSPAKQVRQEVLEDGVFTFRCNLCPKVEFPDKEGLTRHLNSYHSGEHRYYCKFCTRRFQIKANYENHLELDHGRDKLGRELPKKAAPPQAAGGAAQDAAPGTPPAAATGKKGQKQTRGSPQKRKQATITVGSSKKVILTDSLHDDAAAPDADTAEERRRAQEEIQRAFKEWVQARGEELGGENDQRCTCPVCNVTMANTFKLEKHMAVHAAPGKPLPKLRKCYHCARVFLESWQLDRHLEACHTHRCSRCDRVFSVQRDLDEHFVVAHAASGGKKKSTGKKSDNDDEIPPPILEPEVPLDDSSAKSPAKSSAKKTAAKKKTPAKESPKVKKTTGKKESKTPAGGKKASREKTPAKMGTKTKKTPSKKEAAKGPTKKQAASAQKRKRASESTESPVAKKIMRIQRKSSKKKKPTPSKAAKKTPQKVAKKTPTKSPAKKTPQKKTPAKKTPQSSAKKASQKTAQKSKTPNKKATPKSEAKSRKAASPKTPKGKGGATRGDSSERKSPRKPHPKNMPDGFVMTGSEWRVGLKVREPDGTVASGKGVGKTRKQAEKKSPAGKKGAKAPTSKGKSRAPTKVTKSAKPKVVSKKVKSKVVAKGKPSKKPPSKNKPAAAKPGKRKAPAAPKKPAKKPAVAKSSKAKAAPGKQKQPAAAKPKPAKSQAAATPVKKKHPAKAAVAQGTPVGTPVRLSLNGKQVYSYGGKSLVWKYFGFYKNGNEFQRNVAICLVCGVEKSYRAEDCSTANLRSHIQHQHHTLWDDKFSPGKKK